MKYLKSISIFLLFIIFFLIYPFIFSLLLVLYFLKVFPLEEIKKKMGFIKVPNKNIYNVTWFHFSSLGEYNGLKGFIKEYKKKNKNPILITYFNPDVIDALEKDKLFDVYLSFPLENLWVYRKIIKQFSIDKIFFYENEFWPFFMSYLYLNNIKMYLLNGFIQDKEYRNMRYVHPLYYFLLREFNFIFCASEKHKKRFIHFGVKKENIQVVGNLKYDTHLVEKEKSFKRENFYWNRKTKVMLFLSIHLEEWQLLKETILSLLKKDIKVIIAPRLIVDVDNIIFFLEENKVSFSLMGSINQPADVLVVNTFGQMHKIYPMVDLCFVGGSLTPYGGHNILEPISYNIRTLVGKYMFHFEEVVEVFKDYLLTTNIQQLEKDIDMCFNTPKSDNGYKHLKLEQGVSNKILEYFYILD